MEDPRHGDLRNGNGTEIEGEAPGGFKGKIRGFRIADLVMAIIVVWALAVKPYLDDKRDSERDTAIAKEHAKLAEGQERIAAALGEFAYIISLPQDQRTHLNLGMPQSLRDKLYYDRRPR